MVKENKELVKDKNREIRKIQSQIHAQKDQKSLMDVPYRRMISTSMAKSLSQEILQMLEGKKIYRNALLSGEISPE